MDRTAEIADAVVRVITRGGVAAVSMRVVANEAGVSLGMVQRVVGTKDDLLVLAAHRIVARADEKVAASGLDDSAPGPVLLRALVAVLLTMDGDGVAWLAMLAHSLTEPALAAILGRHDRDARAVVAALLESVSPHPDRDALALLALLDGLGTQMMLGVCTTADAHAVVEDFLAGILAEDRGGRGWSGRRWPG